MFLKKIIFYILILAEFAIAHPYEPDAQMNFPINIGLDYEYSNYHSSQANIDLKIFNGRGFYKDIDSYALRIGYSPRINLNQQLEHKFKFVLFETNGGLYECLLKYGNGYNDTLSGQYLFNQSGIKLLEWKNTDIFREFNIVKLSTELILENRTYHKSHVYGLPYEPNNHNFYLKQLVSVEPSNKKFDNSIFNSKKDIFNNSFWDIPLESYTELGYDWRFEKLVYYKTKFGLDSGYNLVRNTVCIFINYNYLPFNDISIFNYGLKLNLENVLTPCDINFIYRKNEISLLDNKYKFSIVSLGVVYYFF